MKYAIILMFLIGSDLHAADWLCSDEATIRRGNELLVCGMASASDEQSARALSLNNAMAEFKEICDSSSDCKNHEITTDPKRINCEFHNNTYKCTRLISYTIGNELPTQLVGSNGKRLTYYDLQHSPDSEDRLLDAERTKLNRKIVKATDNFYSAAGR